MSTARIVLFGDTHIGFDSPARPRSDRRRRGDDFVANYRRVLDYVAATRPDVLVHLGDFFHRSHVPPAIVDDAFAALAGVADLGVPVLLVPGNHDRSRLPPSLWLGHPNIHVFDRPRTVLIRANGCRLAFAGFPFAWSDLRQSFEGLVDSSGINEIDAEARFICMHHTVAGASVGPNGYTFRSGRDVIPRRHIASKLTAVFSGHIHRSQVLNGAHPPVYYPGSTERTSFAERDEQKGFYDLVISTDHSGAAKVAEATFVPLPSRPMLDLVLESAMTPRQAQSALSSAARDYPADAVVRITADAPGPELAELLSATRLRSIFPPTMNLQLSRSLFDVTR